MIVVPTLDHSITANARVSVKIPVPTNDSTITETRLLLSSTIVDKSPVKKEVILFEVHFFIILFRLPFANPNTDFSK